MWEDGSSAPAPEAHTPAATAATETPCATAATVTAWQANLSPPDGCVPGENLSKLRGV